MAATSAALSPRTAALVQLHDTSGGSEWAWRQLDPGLRGTALLDPAVAQHTSFVRIASAISEEDIAVLVAAAERHKREHAMEESIGSGNSDVQGKLYLHHNGVDAETARIVARIQRLVEATDATHWALLSDEEVKADGPVGPRCVEYHEYAPSEREVCDDHYDAGSLFTADVMLSAGSEFEGGTMQSTAVDAGGVRRVTSHTFERGDLLVFLSHKTHSVSRLTSGRRRVLIIEFWQGGLCKANHRCCDGGVGRDLLCGLCEGAATYYSRYTRDDDEASEKVLGPISTAPPAAEKGQGGGRHSHNYLDGPPYLRCSCPHGLTMLQALYPTSQRLAELHSSDLVCWVDWGLGAPVRGSLTVRHAGSEVARAEGACSQSLRVAFAARRAVPGPFIAELRWEGGHRWLHVAAPPPHPLRLGGLVLPPRSHPRGYAALLAHIEAAEAKAPPMPAGACQLERGFGLEIELLTEVAAWPLPPLREGACEVQTRDRHQPIRSVLARLSSESEAMSEDAHSAALAPVRAALSRCGHWCSDVDVMIQPTPEGLSARMLQATIAIDEMNESERADANGRCMQMLRRGVGSRKSEFQSPSPPRELRFARGAALEVGCFVNGVLASTGAAAASISSSCHSATAIHVHVNVRNPSSGGSILDAMQLCEVVFGWIRFDLITQGFARPWLWCEPSCVPLYATGAEMGTLSHLTWQEVTEAEVSADISDPADRTGDVEAGSGCAPPSKRRKLGDVPALVHAMHAIVHADGFDALSEAEKVDELFGIGGPGADLGRACSLNLTAISKYGTLEVRRFHSTLDSTLLVRWAAFCVAFVEAFATIPSGILSCSSAEAALEALQRAQEMASSDELLSCMAGLVDPETASYFEKDASGAARECNT
jgi:hypothetical protein